MDTSGIEITVADKPDLKATDFLREHRHKLPGYHVVSKHKRGVVIVVDEDYLEEMVDALEGRGFNVAYDE
jgi:hypothetical protein